MSSITLYADLLFDDLHQAQRLEQLFLAQNKDLQDESESKVSPTQEPKDENLSHFLTEEDCDVEEVERSESCLSIVLTGGTLQFPAAALVNALDGLGAVAATIEIIDDQVGDEKRLGRHLGKKCGFTKALKVIDKANPVCGAVRALEDESDRRLLSLLNAGGLDPNARWRRQSPSQRRNRCTGWKHHELIPFNSHW
ncbi:MAG: hypothetical protein OER80_07660 [Gammaproteobacteria bacterium]|nr:hypothetical protein [Gammaproteobacteria bacterium]MDH3766844.1 hypothetical protein [Gammaproteobacteria bacterium]